MFFQNFSTAFVILVSVIVALGSPLPASNGTETLDRRITHTGRGTWYYPGLGNCGEWNTNSDLIVAIGKALYDRNGGGNCNQYMEITDTANGKTAYGKTVDSCQSCGDNDIDMSPTLFQEFADTSVGVIEVSWHFMSQGWTP